MLSVAESVLASVLKATMSSASCHFYCGASEGWPEKRSYWRPGFVKNGASWEERSTFLSLWTNLRGLNLAGSLGNCQQTGPVKYWVSALIPSENVPKTADRTADDLVAVKPRAATSTSLSGRIARVCDPRVCYTSERKRGTRRHNTTMCSDTNKTEGVCEVPSRDTEC